MIEAFKDAAEFVGLPPWVLAVILVFVVFLAWCYYLGGEAGDSEADDSGEGDDT